MLQIVSNQKCEEEEEEGDLNNGSFTANDGMNLKMYIKIKYIII